MMPWRPCRGLGFTGRCSVTENLPALCPEQRSGGCGGCRGTYLLRAGPDRARWWGLPDPGPGCVGLNPDSGPTVSWGQMK